MTRTINLSNTQSRYQIVFFVHIYSYIWLAAGCFWHLLASFAQAKQAWRYVLPEGINRLIQRVTHLNFSDFSPATVAPILILPLPVNSSHHSCSRKYSTRRNLFTLPSWFHKHSEQTNVRCSVKFYTIQHSF